MRLSTLCQIGEIGSEIFYIYKVDSMDLFFVNNLIKKNVLENQIESLPKNLQDRFKALEIIVKESFNEYKFLQEKYSSLILKKPEITVLKIFITDRCNFDCKYCLIQKNIQNNQRYQYCDMAPTVFENVLYICEQIFPKNDITKTVFLYGGEPLLNKDTLIYIIKTIRRHQKFNFY